MLSMQLSNIHTDMAHVNKAIRENVFNVATIYITYYHASHSGWLNTLRAIARFDPKYTLAQSCSIDRAYFFKLNKLSIANEG